MAPNLRVAKAFRAMRDIGIDEEITKPVLKKLLKLYEKNWELIEEENYRALADAIFDIEDTEGAEQQKDLDNAEEEKRKILEQAERMKAIEEETQIQEEPERPLRRSRARHQDDQGSPSCTSPIPNSSESLLKKPKLEVEKLPESRPELQSPEKTVVTEPVSPGSEYVSPLKRARNKGKQPILPNVLIKPNDEPLTDDPVQSKVPVAVIVPEPLINGDTSTENNLAKEPDLSNHFQEKSNDTNGPEPNNIADESSTAKLDIASSSSGEIKISLTCNSAEGKHKLSVTNVDTILKTVEDKCLKSYKLLDPNFSMKKLMKDICEYFLDLGSNDCDNHLILDDIAKGQENVIISLVNEVNTEKPPSFHYIPHNAVFQNAYVDFSLTRIEDDYCCSKCSGNCLTAPTPCYCAQQAGGEFSYTIEGLVKEEILDECIKTNRDPQTEKSNCKTCPMEKWKKNNNIIQQACKGHNPKGFIKECWLKCGCDKKCGNRVVQCGIKHKLQVFMTAGGKGWGLRTLEDLPKGAFVCEFVGEVLTSQEVHTRVLQSGEKDEYSHPVLLDAEWGSEDEIRDDEALCLDATYYGNVARFINHRCFDANLIEIPVEVENPDRHYYHVALFTTRKVKALEELTRDYGIDFDDNEHLVKAFQCRCGSRFCRNI